MDWDKVRTFIRKQADESFDLWDADMAADEAAVDWLCDNPNEALERLLEPIRKEADRIAVEDGDVVLAAVYLNETEAVMRKRFGEMLAGIEAALRRKLDRQDPNHFYPRPA